MKFRTAHITDRGLNPNRPHNEDSLLVAEPLFIVADGLGGELAGEVASQMTIERFRDYFQDATRENGMAPEAELRVVERSIQRVNSFVYAEAQKEEYRNMGSTLSILYFFKNRALIGHVGDSKIFRVRHGEGELLTKDQSIVQQMVDKGIITTEQARRHPMRNVLLSCIAHKPDIDVFTQLCDVQKDDFYLLCSDGVAEYIPPDMITAMVDPQPPPEEICEHIKSTVYAGGAMDNLTAIAVYVDDIEADS